MNHNFCLIIYISWLLIKVIFCNMSPDEGVMKADQWSDGSNSRQEEEVNPNFSLLAVNKGRKEKIEVQNSMRGDNSAIDSIQISRSVQFIAWITSAFLDVGCLVLETVIWVWTAICLLNQNRVAEFRSIIVLLALPSVVNVFVWLKIGGDKNRFGSVDHVSIILLAFVGFPSPILIFVTSLYLMAFNKFDKAETFRTIGVCLRLAQAILCSCPLLLINGVTLINAFRSNGSSTMEKSEKDVFDVMLLQQHLGEVKFHGIAFLISFINLLRAVSCFNERQTRMAMFSLVCLPFLSISALSRITTLSIIISFLHLQWSCILLGTLVIINYTLYGLSRDIPRSSRANSIFTSNWIYSQFRNFIGDLCFSIGSIFVPLGYTRDHLFNHGRLKGAFFIISHYLTNTIVIGIVLGLTVLHWIPNDVYGIRLPQPDVQIQVPGNRIKINAAGLQLSVDLPANDVDLSAMPPVSLNVNTDFLDSHLAVIAPLMFALLTLPFVVIRALMMDMDCVVVSQEVVQSWQVPSAVLDRRSVTVKTFIAILCGMTGVTIITLQIVATLVFIYLHVV